MTCFWKNTLNNWIFCLPRQGLIFIFKYKRVLPLLETGFTSSGLFIHYLDVIDFQWTWIYEQVLSDIEFHVNLPLFSQKFTILFLLAHYHIPSVALVIFVRCTVAPLNRLFLSTRASITSPLRQVDVLAIVGMVRRTNNRLPYSCSILDSRLKVLCSCFHLFLFETRFSQSSSSSCHWGSGTLRKHELSGMVWLILFGLLPVAYIVARYNCIIFLFYSSQYICPISKCWVHWVI